MELSNWPEGGQNPIARFLIQWRALVVEWANPFVALG
jgi:hypothetical protein